MITLFTTFKPFIEKDYILQVNALRSWRQLSSDVEIIVFGEVFGNSSIIRDLNIKYIPDVSVNAENLPFVNSLFSKISNVAKNPICCYINGDIILKQNFYSILCFLHSKLKNKYLICGPRIDVDVEKEISFKQDWEFEFEKIYSESMTLHPPSGSDFFAFPNGQYKESDIESFVIGNPGWDNWIIYDNIINKKYKVINVSNIESVYHQNHKNNYTQKAINDNYSILFKRKSEIYTLNNCNYFLEKSKIINKNSFRKKIIKVLSIYAKKIFSL